MPAQIVSPLAHKTSHAAPLQPSTPLAAAAVNGGGGGAAGCDAGTTVLPSILSSSLTLYRDELATDLVSLRASSPEREQRAGTVQPKERREWPPDEGMEGEDMGVEGMGVEIDATTDEGIEPPTAPRSSHLHSYASSLQPYAYNLQPHISSLQPYVSSLHPNLLQVSSCPHRQRSLLLFSSASVAGCGRLHLQSSGAATLSVWLGPCVALTLCTQPKPRRSPPSFRLCAMYTCTWVQCILGAYPPPNPTHPPRQERP